MATALVDQAVLKFIRGPTSTTVPALWSRKLSGPNDSGSKVSVSSQPRAVASASVNGPAHWMLKQCSVSMPSTTPSVI